MLGSIAKDKVYKSVNKVKAKISCGNGYTIEYIQIPYDDRYHIVTYSSDIIMKIPGLLIDINNFFKFWGSFLKTEDAVSYFKKVKAKNEYLDSSDD